jgi:hypothetical protein
MNRMLLAAMICMAAGSAFAEPESPKVMKARMEAELEKELADVNTKCGTKLTVAIDWASFEKDKAGWDNKSISSYCSSPVNALSRFCDGANAKAYIQKNLETMTCHAAKDKASWKVTFEKGHLHWNVSPDSVNNDDYARAQMLKNM